MSADLAVIGLGHLGLPLAQAATATGVRTVGYDPDSRAADELRAGRVPTGAGDGSLTAAELRRMISGGFRTTTDPADLGRVRTAVICSPTPLGEDRRLDLSAVGEAARTLAGPLPPPTPLFLAIPLDPRTPREF